MFKAKIESAIETLRDELKFESAVFVEDPKYILSEFEGTQIVSYYSRGIVLNPDDESCSLSWGRCYFDLIVLVPEEYITENVIMNVFSFFPETITGIETNSNKIYADVFGKSLTSNYQLIRFNCEIVMPVMKINCCLEMEEC